MVCPFFVPDDSPRILYSSALNELMCSVSGWLCKVRLSDPAEFESLLEEKAYKAHCEGEGEGDS